jgi:hypothetical protein
MWSHGNFYWNEPMAHDVERAKTFYSATIGWTFEAMPMPNGTYWVAKMGDKPVGGIFPMMGPEFSGMQEGWRPILPSTTSTPASGRRPPPAPRRCASPSTSPASAASPSCRNRAGR